MLRNVLKTGLTLNLVVPIDILSSDNLSNETATEQNANRSVLQNETGWDRLIRIFETDEFGTPSPEFVTLSHVGAMSLFVGAMYGGVTHSRVAYVNFIKNNQATAFNDHIEAKKRLQDSVTKSFGRGAWKWGWRLSLFCTSFVGISTGISVYRGKTGFIDYVAAGLITGSMYKLNMGPRGWIVGGGLGATLGFIAGGTTLALLKMSGISMEEVRYWQYHWRQERTDYINKGMAEYIAKEEEGLAYEHSKKIGESGKTLDNIDA